MFVIPGNVDVAACAGSNALLRDGAIAVSTGWDILSEYVALFPDMIRKDTTAVVQTLYPDEEAAVRATERTASKVAQLPRLPKKKAAKAQQCDTIAIDNGAPAPYIENKDTEDPTLTGDERAVLALLKLSSGVVLSTLTLLEVKGLIRRLPGRHVCLVRQKP